MKPRDVPREPKECMGRFPIRSVTSDTIELRVDAEIIRVHNAFKSGSAKDNS